MKAGQVRRWEMAGVELEATEVRDVMVPLGPYCVYLHID